MTKAITEMEYSEGLLFWYQHLGRYLSDVSIEKSSKASVIMRLKKGVKQHTIGAQNVFFYIVTPHHSQVIGQIEMPDTPQITFLPSETTDPFVHIAKWLINGSPEGPFMIGTIDNAGPNESFRVTQSPRLGVFCHANKNIQFNLPGLIQDAKTMSDMSPKDRTDLWKALRLYSLMRLAGNDRTGNAIKDKLDKVFKKQPEFRSMLPKINTKVGSGGVQILDWYFKTVKPKGAAS